MKTNTKRKNEIKEGKPFLNKTFEMKTATSRSFEEQACVRKYREF